MFRWKFQEICRTDHIVGAVDVAVAGVGVDVGVGVGV